jgi:hypothetical protein
VSVIRCSGCSIRPAISQPSAIAAALTTTRAMVPWVSTVFRVLSRVSVVNRSILVGPTPPAMPGSGRTVRRTESPRGSRCEIST